MYISFLSMDLKRAIRENQILLITPMINNRGFYVEFSSMKKAGLIW